LQKPRHPLPEVGARKRNIPPNVIANAINNNKIDYPKKTNQYSAIANLAHLLLRHTSPFPHAKAKEPNSLASFKLMGLI